jgi:hypothetical protein
MNKINKVNKILFILLLILSIMLFYLQFLKKDNFQESCSCKPGDIITRTNECEKGSEKLNNGCGKLILNDTYVCVSEGSASPCE